MQRFLHSTIGFRASWFLLFAITLSLTAANFQESTGPIGNVRLVTIDSSTNKMTPARVEVRGPDGKYHVADDAMRVGIARLDNNEKPLEFDNLDAYLATLRRRIRNAYAKSDQFYTSGECKLTLPVGSYRIRVVKGIEFKAVSRQIEVQDSQETTLELRLSRWADMPAAGWYSADAHVHLPRPTSEINDHFLKWMQAEDIHVANLLQWGHSRHFHNAIQYAHGDLGVYQSDKYILASGLENPRTPFLGHTIMLGTKRAIHLPDKYLLYRFAFEQGKRDGTVNGYAHQGTWFHAQNGLALDLPTGLVDFIEVLQLNIADYSVWYLALNSGFRLVPLAGTDYPVGPIPGWERFYAKVDPPYSFESWLSSVRRGRVFVTNGPLLEFRVEDTGMGEQLSLEEPRDLWIEGSVRFDPDRDDVQRLELIRNAEVVARFEREGDANEIRFRIQHRIDRACWLALRASGQRAGLAIPSALMRQPPHSGPTGGDRHVAPSLAHSSPVYVTIRGKPTLQQGPEGRAATWAWLARLRDFEQVVRSARIHELADEGFGPSMDGVSIDLLLANRSALIETIRESENQYLERMGGTNILD